MSKTLLLDPKLDLSAVTALSKTLSGCDDKELIFDLSQVRHLGALCVQLLIAAATSAIREGRSITMINASDRVIGQLRVMGLTPETICGGRT